MSMRAGGDSNRRLDIEIGTQHIGRAVEQQAGTQFNFLVGPFFNRDNGQRLAFTSAFRTTLPLSRFECSGICCK